MEVLSIVLPVFMVILTGLIAGYMNFIPKELGIKFLDFVFKIPLPFLIVIVLAKESIESMKIWSFYSIFGGSMLGVLIVLAIFFILFGKETIGAILYASSATMVNAAFIGLPLLVGMFGNQALIPAAGAIAILFLVFAISLIAMELVRNMTSGEGSFFSSVAKTIQFVFTTPTILATFIGVIWAISRVPVPGFIDVYFQTIGNITAGLALFAIGLDMKMEGIMSDLWQSFGLSFTKLIVMPAIVLGLCVWMGVSPFLAVTCVISAGVPTAKLVYLVSNQYDNSKSMIGSVIISTTIVSIGTLIILTFILAAIYPTVFSGGHYLLK